MKLITVPVDFSKYSDYATDVALQIAKQNNSTINFVHCIERGDINTSEVEPKLKELIERANNFGVNAKSFTETGLRAHKVITEHVKQYNSDLIVMGTHGLTPGESQFIGTNSQRVVRYSPCPVLSIKYKHTDFKIDRIVYPSDFNFETDRMYKQVIKLATLFNAQIDLVFINTPENFVDTKTTLDKMSSFCKQQPYSNTQLNIYNDFNSIDGIINFSKQCNTDIIAMSTLGKTGIHRFLDNSITENIVNYSDLPVLSLCSTEIVSG